MADALLHLAGAVDEHLLVAQRARGLREEEVDAAEQSLDLVARLPDGLADFERERLREVFQPALDQRTECRDRRQPLASIGRAAQPGCAARARSYLARTALALSAGTSASTAPVAGLMIFIAMAFYNA